MKSGILRRRLAAVTLLVSLAAHASVLGTVRLYSNKESFENGALREVEVFNPTPTPNGKPASPVHQHQVVSDAELPTGPVAPSATEDIEESNGGSSEGTSQPDQGFAEEEVDVPARLYVKPHLVYPRRAFEEGLEGDVVLFIVVNELGSVVEAEITTPAGHGFDESALAAAKRLRFRPAEREGAPVTVHFHWTCHFRIEG